MKKCFGIFIFVLFFVILTHEVRADYASSYQDYINKTGVYQSDYNNYLTARANYLASQSIDSQDKAKATTLKMLQSRDDVVSSFLTAMKSKIQSTQGISSSDQGSFSSRADTEIGWYNAHRTRLSSAGSLDDLVADSDEAKAQYDSTSLLVYQSVVALGIANNSYIRNEINNEISTLRAKIDEIKANQDKDVSLIERSLVDVQNKLSRSQTKDSDAANLVNSIKPTDRQKSNDFQDSQSDVADSNSYLKEANDGLLQIISQIKSAN